MKQVKVLRAVLFLVVAACGGADDSSLLKSSNPPATADGAAPIASDGGVSADAAPVPTGSSTSGDAAAPPDAAAPLNNAFTGAPAYVATLGRNARKNDHGNGGNPAKLACLTCHRAGGDGPRWFAGGTVFANVQGTTPAPRVEVRFSDAAGNAAPRHTENALIRLPERCIRRLTSPTGVTARMARSTEHESSRAISLGMSSRR